VHSTHLITVRYKTLLIRTYVDDKPHIKWCPHPNCEHAVDCRVPESKLDTIVPTVHCTAEHVFCFGCSFPQDHQPAPCAIVRRWNKKCADDSETSNWLMANTKECIKCKSTIEKNGGCNHMTCKKCRAEVIHPMVNRRVVLLGMSWELGRARVRLLQLQPVRREVWVGGPKRTGKVTRCLGTIPACTHMAC
jgi:hypothetical protein